MIQDYELTAINMQFNSLMITFDRSNPAISQRSSLRSRILSITSLSTSMTGGGVTNFEFPLLSKKSPGMKFLNEKYLMKILNKYMIIVLLTDRQEYLV